MPATAIRPRCLLERVAINNRLLQGTVSQARSHQAAVILSQAKDFSVQDSLLRSHATLSSRVLNQLGSPARGVHTSVPAFQSSVPSAAPRGGRSPGSCAE